MSLLTRLIRHRLLNKLCDNAPEEPDTVQEEGILFSNMKSPSNEFQMTFSPFTCCSDFPTDQTFGYIMTLLPSSLDLYRITSGFHSICNSWLLLLFNLDKQILLSPLASTPTDWWAISREEEEEEVRSALNTC